MAGIFAEKDEPRCLHYAAFMSHLTRWQFDVGYWLLFICVLLLMFTAASTYSKALADVDQFNADSPEHKKRMKRCLRICIGLFLGSVAALVFEVFMLFALEFCDGEDLMPLFWSTWAMTQVGSSIAIVGIILAVWHSMRGRNHPPWALALGTPVLVLAGLGHFIYSTLHRWRQRTFGIAEPLESDTTQPWQQ